MTDPQCRIVDESALGKVCFRVESQCADRLRHEGIGQLVFCQEAWACRIYCTLARSFLGSMKETSVVRRYAECCVPAVHDSEEPTEMLPIVEGLCRLFGADPQIVVHSFFKRLQAFLPITQLVVDRKEVSRFCIEEKQEPKEERDRSGEHFLQRLVRFPGDDFLRPAVGHKAFRHPLEDLVEDEVFEVATDGSSRSIALFKVEVHPSFVRCWGRCERLLSEEPIESTKDDGIV